VTRWRKTWPQVRQAQVREQRTLAEESDRGGEAQEGRALQERESRGQIPGLQDLLTAAASYEVLTPWPRSIARSPEIVVHSD
jgi:hypothetical protein